MYKEWERGFVLHCRSFGDTSLIVDLFSKNQGKISVLAKGAKKPRSKYFGIFTPFKEVKITLSGRSDLKTVNEVDIHYHSSASLDSKSTYSYLYINELLSKVLPKSIPNLDLFNLYQSFVEKFNSSSFDEANLRHFELDLLDELGFGINFDISAENQNLEDNQIRFIFVPEQGLKATQLDSGFTLRELKQIKSRKLRNINKNALKELTQSAILSCLDGKQILSGAVFGRLKN